ncbi:MAG: phosphatase PAP2 family protein [Actinomycetota bacterium]|nr:phosphatase PAP2 family protein [Actinomycetota bacterium]
MSSRERWLSVSPDRRWRRLLPAVGYAVGAAVPVTALALLARERVDAVINLDNDAILAATDVTRSHPGLLTALLVWQEALQPRWVYLVGTGVAVWIWWRYRLTSRAIWGFVTMMVAWNIALDLKYIVQRTRPVVEQAVSHAPGYSFPSGHAADTAAAATVVSLMVWPLLRTRWQKALVCDLAAAVVVLTALDRVFLGVHFPSDVVAGMLLGSGLALASYAGYRGWRPSEPTDLPDTPEQLDTAAEATSVAVQHKET